MHAPNPLRHKRWFPYASSTLWRGWVFMHADKSPSGRKGVHRCTQHLSWQKGFHACEQPLLGEGCHSRMGPVPYHGGGGGTVHTCAQLSLLEQVCSRMHTTPAPGGSMIPHAHNLPQQGRAFMHAPCPLLQEAVHACTQPTLLAGVHACAQPPSMRKVICTCAPLLWVRKGVQACAEPRPQ